MRCKKVQRTAHAFPALSKKAVQCFPGDLYHTMTARVLRNFSEELLE